MSQNSELRNPGKGLGCRGGNSSQLRVHPFFLTDVCWSPAERFGGREPQSYPSGLEPGGGGDKPASNLMPTSPVEGMLQGSEETRLQVEEW